jgi:cytochrome c peroxidase
MKKQAKALFAFCFLACVACCLQMYGWAEDQLTPAQIAKTFARPKIIPYPADNQYLKDKELLGKSLFFDPRLSGSNSISCATCHSPSFSWSNGLRRGIGHGHKELGRRSPTIINMAWSDRFFWDGRASSLEEQALGPMFAAGEMHGNPKAAVKTVSELEDYKSLFAKAFPNEPITSELIAKAIATYERGIISGEASFDKYIAGETNAISLLAIQGFKLFTGKAKCVACHSGWSFTDGSFHDIGIKSNDIGRGKFLPRLALMQHAFKTPTLRNVELRRPYMHDGSEATLESVVDLYDKGGAVKRGSVAAEITPLDLTKDEKTALVEFMKSLTSIDQPTELPVLPTK